MTRDAKFPIWAIPLGLFCAVLWSAHSSVSGLALRQGATHFDLAFLRAVGSAFVFLPWLIKKKFEPVRRIPVVRSLVISSCVGIPFVLINTFGLYFSPITHSGLLSLGMINFFSVIFGFFVLGEKISLPFFFRLLLIPLGLLVFGMGLGHADLPNNFWIGDVSFLIAAITWAVYAVFTKKWGYASLDCAALVSFYSLMYVPFYVGLVNSNLFSLSISILFFQLLYQGILIGGLALFIFLRLTEVMGISKGTIFSAIPPVGTAIAGKLILGQESSWNEWCGLLLVTVGIYLILRFKASKA